jgi:polyhydroxybutyrate depolymerase
MLAYRLAAEAADQVAAIAPVAGAMALDTIAARPPVPVLHIHSVDDPRALYAGGVRESFGRAIRHRAVEAQLALWRERDGCAGEAAVLATRERTAGNGGSQRAELLSWAPCAAGSEVRLWRLHGVGHGWPGAGPVLPEHIMGPATEMISAADEVWGFVRRFRLGTPRGATR